MKLELCLKTCGEAPAVCEITPAIIKLASAVCHMTTATAKLKPAAFKLMLAFVNSTPAVIKLTSAGLKKAFAVVKKASASGRQKRKTAGGKFFVEKPSAHRFALFVESAKS